MLPDYYEFYNPVKIVSGHKALENLPYELDQLGAKRPIIVTDKGVSGAGLVDIVKNAFADSDMIIGAIFDNTPPDSSIDTVNELVKVYRSNDCDSIVAVGGGSVIDTAKGLNIVITEDADDLAKFMGAEMLKKPMKPLIVIPTTSGTGSEVTLAAVINNPEKKMKMPFTSYHLLPKVAILDTRMTLTMPPKITAATGMDALTHAVEAFICDQKNPVSDAHAMVAISMIRDNLVKAVKDRKDKKARLAMSNASCLAGAAFSNSMVGIVHALGHATGGVCHVPHGVAMSIFLPFGLEYNIDASREYISELLFPLGGAEIYAATPKDKRAEKSIELIRNLQKELHSLSGLPMTLKEAGVEKSQLEEIAKTAINDGSLIYNPLDVNVDEALAVLKKAYE
ncbi:iron-containing alcohol dehydrogenase [bacterium]|nr:iron-containing alcohol dehydrogenase [bacterium]